MTSQNKKTTPKACDNLNARIIDGETVILNRSSDQIHTLNSTASVIWEMIESETSSDEMISKLTDSFDISSETASADLDAILEELIKLELIKY